MKVEQYSLCMRFFFMIFFFVNRNAMIKCMFQSDFMLTCWTFWLFSFLFWFLFAEWHLFWHVIRIYILCVRRLSIANAFWLGRHRGRGNKAHEPFRIKWKCDGFDVLTIFSSIFSFCFSFVMPNIFEQTHGLYMAYIRLFTFISNQLNLLHLIHLWKSCIIFLIPSTDAINISLFLASMRYKIIVIFIICFFFLEHLFFALHIIHFWWLMFVLPIEFNISKRRLP